MQGLFITVEGIDGSGKTTVANAIAERLRKEGFAVVVTAEPGGTPLGERLRQLLLREKPLSAWAEAFLFLAARAEHVAQVIRGVTNSFASAALSFGQVGMLKAGDSLYGPGSNFSHRRTI